MPTNPVPFVENGMPPALAVEVARQIDVRTGPKPTYFIGLGMPPALAVEVSRQAFYRVPNIPNLIGLGMPIELATAVAAAITTVTLQIGATGGTIPYGVLAKTTKLKTVFRVPIVIGSGDLSQIVLAGDNWYISNTGGSTNAGQAMTITGMALEQNSPALTVPVTFSGSLTAVMTDGQADFHSDPIYPSSFGKTVFSRDDTYWVRGTATIPAAGNFPVGPSVSYGHNAKAYYYDPSVSDPNQVYLTGALTQPTSADSNVFSIWPSKVLGKFVSPSGKRSIINLGDSVEVGTNDTTSIPISGVGYGRRAALTNDLPTNTLAIMTAAHGSISAAQLGLNTKVAANFAYANMLKCELANVDILDGATAAAAYASLATIWTAFRAAGGQRVLQSGAFPRTTSTDSWATAVNQTYVADFGPGEVAAQLTALIAAAVGGAVDAMPNYAATMGDPTLPLKWITTGAANYATEDGVHPETIIHQGMATVQRASALSVTVI